MDGCGTLCVIMIWLVFFWPAIITILISCILKPKNKKTYYLFSITTNYILAYYIFFKSQTFLTDFERYIWKLFECGIYDTCLIKTITSNVLLFGPFIFPPVIVYLIIKKTEKIKS